MKALRFLKSVSLLLILNLLVKPIWIFLIDRQVQVEVGHQVYGEYFALLNLSIIMIFLADAGISNLLNQNMAAGAPVHVFRFIRIKAVLLTIFAATCLFVAWLTGVNNWELMFYIISIQVATSLFVFLRSVISARQLFTADAWLSVLDKSLMILLCSAFLYGIFQPIDIVKFLQLQLVATVAANLAALLFIYRRSLLVNSSGVSSENILKRLMPFAAIILLMSVHNRLDGFLLYRLADDGAFESGIYASAYRLLDAGNMVGYLAASFLLPFVARHQHDAGLVQKICGAVTGTLLTLGFFVAAFVLVFSDWLQQLLYHSNWLYISRLFQLVLITLPAYYLVHVYGTLYTARTKFRPFIITLAVAVVLNIVLNLLLIPRYGAQGAAASAVISQYACGISLYLSATNSQSNALKLLAPLLSFGFFVGFFHLANVYSANVWMIVAASLILLSVWLIFQIVYFRKNFVSHA